MADTQYYVRADRYTRQAETVDRYSTTGVAPAVATAFRSLKFVSSWSSILRETAGGFPNHTGSLTASSRLYDAYAFCGDHDAVTGQHRAFVGCVAYRVKLPSAFYAGGALIKSVTVTINGDPYLADGIRIACVNNSTSTPDADWANIISGSVNATGVAKRTTVVSGSSTKWYGTTETKTLVLNASGVQATQYLWIYLSLEDYTKAHRLPWVEGGAALSPDMYITYTAAVGGYNAGTDIGGNELVGEVSCSRSSLWSKTSAYYFQQMCTTQGTSVNEKINAMIPHFAANCSLIESDGPPPSSGSTKQDYVGLNAGLYWLGQGGGFNAYIGNAIFAGVYPVSVTIPANMRIRNVLVAAPPAWSDCTFVMCAYLVTGALTPTNSKIVPYNNAAFWLGTSATQSIGGDIGTFLGSVTLTSSAAITIPVPKFTPYEIDTNGLIYLTLMPVASTGNPSNSAGGGSIEIGEIYYASASGGITVHLKDNVSGFFNPWIPTTVKISD